MKVKYLVQVDEKLVSFSAEVTWKATNGLWLTLGLEKGRMVGKFMNLFVCLFCFLLFFRKSTWCPTCLLSHGDLWPVTCGVEHTETAGPGWMGHKAHLCFLPALRITLTQSNISGPHTQRGCFGPVGWFCISDMPILFGNSLSWEYRANSGDNSYPDICLP